MRLSKEASKRLLRISRELRQTCHKKTCENYEESPNECPEMCCDPKFLGYETAIAWTIAKELERFTADKSFKKESLRSFYSGTFLFQNVLSLTVYTVQKSQEDRYNFLLDSLSNMRYIIRNQLS